MPRLPRYNLANIPQHIIQRGNNKQDTFKEEEDYLTYLLKLEEYAVKYSVNIHSYVLMTNHVHLLATPTDEFGVSKMMQALGRFYVRYFNVKNNRTGTLWEGRFKSTLVDSDFYFLAVSRYIELNPVRANMVKQPQDYLWSSYHFNANGRHETLLTPHPCYIALAVNNKNRMVNYLNLFSNHIQDTVIQEIRDSTNKSWVLGGANFKKIISAQTGRVIKPSTRGGDRKSEGYKKNHLL